MYYTLADLKAFLQSLSGAEKRNFTLFSGLYRTKAKEPAYVTLYQALNDPKTDISDFSDALSGEAKTTAQKQLFKNLRRSLRLYHEEQSVDTELACFLVDIEVAYRHSLPEQGLYLLQKAFTLARAHECFSVMLQLLQWERRLNIILDHPTRSTDQIQLDEADTLKKLQQILDLENIYSKAKTIKKQYGYAKGDMSHLLRAETIDAPRMPSDSACRSRTAMFYYNLIYTLYHWMSFNHVEAFRYSQRLLSPTVQAVLPNDYVDAILENVTSCVCLGRFNAALSGLAVCATYIKNQKLDHSHSFSVRMFYYEICYHIIIYNFTGNRAKLQQTISEAEAKLTEFDKMLSLEMKKVIQANLMNAYLGIGDFDKVNALWDMLFVKQVNQERKDIYDDLYLFRLFNLFQNGHFWLVRSMASSAYRYYKGFEDHQTRFPLELKIAGLLQKDLDLDNRDCQLQVLNSIRSFVSAHIKRLDGALNFQEQYSFYLIWAQSLISGKLFYQEAKAWHKQFSSTCK